MNRLSISINIDQNAALLKGIVLGPTALVEVGPDTVPADVWPALVGALNMAANPPALTGYGPGGQGYKFSEATEAAIIAGIRDAYSASASAAAKALADNEARLAAWEANPINKRNTVTNCGTDRDGKQLVLEHEVWSVAYLSAGYGTPASLIPSDWEARVKAGTDRITPEIAAHNAIAEAKITELREIGNAAQAERDAAEKERKATELAARKAKRLETGLWEKETDAYNDKRYGAPWCAKVTFPTGPKPVYTFGESSGKWGKAGVMVLACKPGEIIAWGQKDHRRPADSEHNILHMQPDGGMVNVTVAEAYKIAGH